MSPPDETEREATEHLRRPLADTTFAGTGMRDFDAGWDVVVTPEPQARDRMSHYGSEPRSLPST